LPSTNVIVPKRGKGNNEPGTTQKWANEKNGKNADAWFPEFRIAVRVYTIAQPRALVSTHHGSTSELDRQRYAFGKRARSSCVRAFMDAAGSQQRFQSPLRSDASPPVGDKLKSRSG